MCLKLSNPRQLKPKHLTKNDKCRAAKLRLLRIEVLAREENLAVPQTTVADLANDMKLIKDASLSAYGASLIQRLQGISPGPAILALWRSFAWDSLGAPIHNFKLSAASIINAEHQLLTRLRNQSF